MRSREAPFAPFDVEPKGFALRTGFDTSVRTDCTNRKSLNEAQGLFAGATTLALLYIAPNIWMDEREIREEFVRSSGPGGQNVNKVATAVKLRFDALRSPALPDEVKKRLIRLAGKKMNRKGELIIDARRFRTQEQNRKDAMDRLIGLVRKAVQKPKPRLKTKPTSASRERRLEAKHKRSDIKQARRAPAVS